MLFNMPVYLRRDQRNELTQRIVADATGTSTYDLTYDPNGNLTSDDEKYDYVYNPFGQLVQVKLTGTSKVAANYTYNALGHRISEQLDTTDTSTPPGSGIPDGDTDAFDPVFFIATDLQGRRVATYRDTDSDPKECFAYHNPSGSGKAGAMGPILRTRNSQEQIPTNLATVAGSSTHDERYYYTSDFRGNVAAIVSSGGLFIEQYRYSATGVPMGIPRGDVDSNGLVDGATSGDPDYDQADWIDKTTYHVRTDWNLDGDIDGTDTAVVMAEDGTATGRKEMSAPAVKRESPDGIGKYPIALAMERVSSRTPDPTCSGYDPNPIRMQPNNPAPSNKTPLGNCRGECGNLFYTCSIIEICPMYSSIRRCDAKPFNDAFREVVPAYLDLVPTPNATGDDFRRLLNANCGTRDCFCMLTPGRERTIRRELGWPNGIPTETPGVYIPWPIVRECHTFVEITARYDSGACIPVFASPSRDEWLND